MDPDTNTPQTPPQAPPPPARTRGWVRVLLVVSLGLNLLIIGAVAGLAIKGGPMRHAAGKGHPVADSVGPLTKALSKEDRWAIGRQIRQATREAGWDRRKHRETLREMTTLLEATPFDEAAFAAQLAEITGWAQTRIETAQVVLVEHLASMTDEERAAYAQRVREVMARKGKKD